MDIDMEDALAVAEEAHQICLTKRKMKFKQSRLVCDGPELVSSESILSCTPSLFETDDRNLSQSASISIRNDVDDDMNSINDENVASTEDKGDVDQSHVINCIVDQDQAMENYFFRFLSNLNFCLDALCRKYRISADRYDEFYSILVRPKLVDFLADERKRNRKSTSIQSSISFA